MKRRVYLISGTGDHILPAKYTRPDFTIKGAGHFMVYANSFTTLVFSKTT